MNNVIIECYEHPPSALHYMARAVLPSSGIASNGQLPDTKVCWKGMTVTPKQLQAFSKATGLSTKSDLSILLPHVFGFRLQMAMLTHRTYPLPIWKALQIRNRLVRFKLFDVREEFNLETWIGGHRYTEKGIEIDLLSRMTVADECHWESLITYFYRGRYGSPFTVAPRQQPPALDGANTVELFQIPDKGRGEFGRLTGDFNGIHLWSWYARRLGFPTAFPHPQRVASMCLSRLSDPGAEAQTLELWIKGPVFYGANVRLRASQTEDDIKFGLLLEGEDRAAFIGHWQSGEANIGTAHVAEAIS